MIVVFAGPPPAFGFTVTATPGRWCTPSPWGQFAVASNATNFTFRCSGTFALDGDPVGSALGGSFAVAQINAPPGITITSAIATGSVFYSSAGWAGGSYFAGGGSTWQNGSTTMTDPAFASPYWGYQVVCLAGYSCTGAGRLILSSITLTASESQGPSLSPQGPHNLWDQNATGEWIWNPVADPWPITLAASDTSGVCSMSVAIGNHELLGPSSVPQTSAWQQCPDPTWTPSSGAEVDTQDYVSGSASLPLKILATNAAGVSTSYSETLHVDNVPVTLALNTSNDRTIWTNHAVTVYATANAGPSGVGGTNCSVGGSNPQPYAARGVTVDGDGVHTVLCTAWNNAVGPQGQSNSTSSSTAVKIDEVPPTLSFEPQNPRDLTGLIVDANDAESGVATTSIEMAPAGTNNWVNVPASFNGAQLAGRFDDAERTGPYVFKATSCDNAGNCASTTERMTLPVRAASDSEVSLTKIVNPVRRKVVVKRVLVGWHWATVHRGGKSVRVKTGGHFRTIKIVEYIQTCTTKRVKAGPHTWRIQRTCTSSHPHLTTTLRVPYGRPVKIHGLYTTGQGVPISGQRVHILAAPDNGFQDFTELASATTDSNGSWIATLPPGPSRIIKAQTDGTATVLPSSGQVTALVPAQIRLLKVWPRHVAWGGTVHLVGQLFGGYLPAGGALVRLRIGYKSTYSTYGVEEHVTGDGRFSTIATFGPGDPSISRTYWFQVASLPMGNYPFAPAASQRVPVLVGGHPG